MWDRTEPQPRRNPELSTRGGKGGRTETETPSSSLSPERAEDRGHPHTCKPGGTEERSENRTDVSWARGASARVGGWIGRSRGQQRVSGSRADGRGGVRHPWGPQRWSTGTSPVTSRSKKGEKRPDGRDAGAQSTVATQRGSPLGNHRACRTQRRFQKTASREAGYG